MRTSTVLFCLAFFNFSTLLGQNDWRESLFAFEKKLVPRRLFELPDGRLAIIGQTDDRSKNAFCLFVDGQNGQPLGQPIFFAADGPTIFDAFAALPDGSVALAGRQNGGGGRPDVGFWVLIDSENAETARVSVAGRRESAILATVATAENRLAVAGFSNDGGGDMPFLALFDGKNEVWSLSQNDQKALGGSIRALVLDEKGQLVALGRTAKGRVWLARVDAETGKTTAQKIFDQKEMGDPARLLAMPDGSFWLAGRVADSGARDWNLWTARVGEGLELIESKTWRDLRCGSISSLALAPSGDVLAVGSGRSEVPLWRDKEAFSTFFDAKMDSKSAAKSMVWRGGKFNDGWLDAVLAGDGSMILLGKKGAPSGPDSLWLERLPMSETAAAKAQAQFEIEKIEFKDKSRDGVLSEGEAGWIDLKIKNLGAESLVALEVAVRFSDAAAKDFLKIEYGEKQTLALVPAAQTRTKQLSIKSKKAFSKSFLATVTVSAGGFSTKKTVEVRGSKDTAAPVSTGNAKAFFSDNSQRGKGESSNSVRVEIDVHASEAFGLPNLELIQMPEGIQKSGSSGAAKLEWLKASEGFSARYSNDILLLPGENNFILRLKKDGQTLGEYRFSETLDLSKRSPNLHVVSMGIEYGERDAVKFTGADAHDFAATFDDQTGLIFKEIMSKSLLSTRETTKSAIENQFSKLRAFDPKNPQADAVHENDVVLVFISGHGIVRDGTFYLLPADHDQQSVLVPFQEKVYGPLSKLPCKVVIVLDACFSGAASKSGDFLAEEAEIRRVMDDLESQSGAIMVASCKSAQVSWEHPTKKHGVFTLAWLEAFSKGCAIKKSGADGGCYLSLGDIFRYIEDRTPEICRELGRESQFPRILTPSVDKDKIWLYKKEK